MLVDASILGALLFALSVFVGTTFTGSEPVLIVALFAIGGRLLLAARKKNGPPPAKPNSSDPTSRWMQGPLAWIVPVLVSAVAIAWRSTFYHRENSNPILLGADFIAHGCFFACLVGWCLRPSRGHVMMPGAAMMTSLACVVAGGASQSLLGQITVGLVVSAGFLLASQIILKPVLSTSVPNSDTPTFGFSWMSPSTLFALLVASGMLAGTSLLARGTAEVLPGIQKTLQSYLNGSLEDITEHLRISGSRYVDGSKLGSIREHQLGSPEEIAIRCYAESNPGYLRCKVFRQYTKSRWIKPDTITAREYPPTGAGVVQPLGVKQVNLNRFDIPSNVPLDSDLRKDQSPEEIKTIEIHNRAEKGMAVFTSLTTRWIEAAAHGLKIGDNSVVDGRGVDLTTPYIIGLTKDPDVFQLREDQKRTLQFVPGDLNGLMQNLANELCDEGQSAREKGKAVSEYFQKNFSYSLDPVTRPRRIDPLKYFLQEGHPAHCEFFASATALILRKAGIPTRYVVGYIAMEKSLEEEYYMARNRDAHAWVEAYDAETSTWFPVESTPGRNYRSLQFGLGLDDDIVDDEADAGIGFEGPVGFFSWLQAMIAKSGITDMIGSAFRLAQLPLFFLLLGLLWYHNRLRTVGSVDADELACAKLLKKVDRKVARKRFFREPHETLHQFADRIESSESANSQEELASFASWYREFAVARYTGQMPTA